MTEEEIRKKVKIKFTDLPISRFTINGSFFISFLSDLLLGLNKRNFKVMTEIQRCVLPHALADSNEVYEYFLKHYNRRHFGSLQNW